MTKEIKKMGVIFDMDGCLLNTETAYRIAWKNAFNQYAVDITQYQIDSWLGLAWDLVEKEINLITKNKELTLAIRNAREENFDEMLAHDRVDLMPGALEILRFVTDNKLMVGLASSTLTHKGQRLLERFDLQDYFDFFVFGDEVKERKPAGDIYLLAIEKSGLSKEKLLVFEDSLVGCLAANAAELQTVWIPEIFSESIKEDYPQTVCKILPSMWQAKKIISEYLVR